MFAGELDTVSGFGGSRELVAFGLEGRGEFVEAVKGGAGELFGSDDADIRGRQRGGGEEERQGYG